MRLALVPRTTEFYDLFTRAGQNLLETARLVEQRFSEFPADTVRQADVKALEHQGDEVTREILELLNTQYVTPFDREDIYELAKAIDDVVDYMDNASDLLRLYKVESRLDRPVPPVTRANCAPLKRARSSSAAIRCGSSGTMAEPASS